MASPTHHTPANHIDIEQLVFEAQHRWLRTPEICEILRNYNHFNVNLEPPIMPPSGSLFLFDRKVQRYFRKDGHRWRKKKDGKTIKEAHEKLKAGSIDVLHCYYAHGEGNEKFQRRSYWMLEEKLSHIVLVHYREVKGIKTIFNHLKETEEAIVNSLENEQSVPQLEAEKSMNSGLQQDSYQVSSHNTASRSLKGAQASDYEVAESGTFQAKPTIVSSVENDEDQSSQKQCKEIESWEREDALESRNVRMQSASAKQPDSVRVKFKQGQKSSQSLQISGEDAMHLGSACKLADTSMPNSHDHIITNRMCMDKHNVDSMVHVMDQVVHRPQPTQVYKRRYKQAQPLDGQLLK